MTTTILSEELQRRGLNLQAVLDLKELPNELLTKISAATNNLEGYTQLILVAHGGTRLWSSIKEEKFISDDPIDDFSVQQVSQFLTAELGNNSFEIIYPGLTFFSLQELGELVGWHHTSPFRIGINAKWGTWFAYRVVALMKSDFETTKKDDTPSPCDTCKDRVCISSCPAKAEEDESLSSKACFTYRKQNGSSCQVTCLSRINCPIGSEHQYSSDQLKYHYGRSLRSLKQMSD